MSSSARPPDSFPSTPAVEHAPETRSWSERFKRWIVSSPRLHAVVIAVLALALVAGAVAHLIELRGVREAAADERSALVQSATKELTDREVVPASPERPPARLGDPGALLKDDFATADAYVQRMVQEKHVTGVALVTADGKVRLAGSPSAPRASRRGSVPRSGLERRGAGGSHLGQCAAGGRSDHGDRLSPREHLFSATPRRALKGGGQPLATDKLPHTDLPGSRDSPSLWASSELVEQAFTRAAGAPLVNGNAVRLLKDGLANYPAWFDAIRAARKSVTFENYIIEDDEVGRELAAALTD